MLTTIIVTVIAGCGDSAPWHGLFFRQTEHLNPCDRHRVGILGALIGSWLWTGVFNKGETSGIDWIALIMGVIVAAILRGTAICTSASWPVRTTRTTSDVHHAHATAQALLRTGHGTHGLG